MKSRRYAELQKTCAETHVTRSFTQGDLSALAWSGQPSSASARSPAEPAAGGAEVHHLPHVSSASASPELTGPVGRFQDATLTEATRFWSHVSIAKGLSGCWLWTGSKDKDGYGRFRSRRRGIVAHRYAYELHNGPPPAGMDADHLCRVRACQNPSHIEMVPHVVNVRRGSNTRINAEIAAAIRADTRSIPEIALAYGMSRSAAGNIRAGRRWAATDTLGELSAALKTANADLEAALNGGEA